MKPSARKLDIVLRSAAGLKKVSSSRMAAYAVAWIEPSLRVPSPADKRHGRNPEWNTTISITLDDRALSQAGQRLHIELLGQGLVSTKPIGFVTVDMTGILLKGSQGAAVHEPFHEYPVRRRSGRQQGILNFELRLQASSTHTPGAAIHEELAEDVSVPLLPPRYQQRESTRMETQQTAIMGNSSNFHPRKSMSRLREAEGVGYSFPAPMATTNSRGSVPKQQEIALLHSYYN